MTETDSRVAGGEMPVDLTLVGVDGLLPGGEFPVESVEVSDPAPEAPSGEAR